MNLLYHSLAFYLALVSPALTTAASSSSSSSSPSSATPPAPSSTAIPCTIRSPNTHAFFDLNPLHIPLPSLSKAKHPRPNSYNTTGYDIGYNFTLNFCGGVIEDLAAKGGVVGVEKAVWGNVSAYYEVGGKVYSIGQENHAPVLRGRKLVMNYTDGSPCGEDAGGKRAHTVEDLTRRAILDDDDDDDDDEDDKKRPKKPSKDEDDDRPKKPSPFVRRKNTLISFLCDRDPLAAALSLSFIGTSPDSCTYLFEARTPYGCGGIEKATQTLSPSG
ncbi:Cation-independent mannose-6-phosphate receptor CI-MPR, partial [Teratosphaeriaceae sp. CCFEE 6253]